MVCLLMALTTPYTSRPRKSSASEVREKLLMAESTYSRSVFRIFNCWWSVSGPELSTVLSRFLKPYSAICLASTRSLLPPERPLERLIPMRILRHNPNRLRVKSELRDWNKSRYFQTLSASDNPSHIEH